jgi:exodeoxyribonuclease VII small subunit
MARKKAAGGAAAPTFEEALVRLEAIVAELEESDLPLERSLAVFEEGVRLSRLLHERLNEAERKVEILMKNEAGEKVAVPFKPVAERNERPTAADDAGGEEDGDAEGGGASGQSALPF